jgi:hypothetical protein
MVTPLSPRFEMPLRENAVIDNTGMLPYGGGPVFLLDRVTPASI